MGKLLQLIFSVNILSDVFQVFTGFVISVLLFKFALRCSLGSL